MSSPVLLAIECSQQHGGVALQDRSGHVYTVDLEPGIRRDDVLQPAIESLFDQAGLAPPDLEGCGCSLGPGGFTGLRITIAIARAMAIALRIPLYGIPSAVVAALSTPTPPGRVIVALASKGESAWLTRIEHPREGRWAGPGELVTADDLGPWLEGVVSIIADEHFPGSFKEAAEAASIEIMEPRYNATCCLQMTSDRHKHGLHDDPMAMLPLYPRPPEAVSLWEAREGT